MPRDKPSFLKNILLAVIFFILAIALQDHSKALVWLDKVCLLIAYLSCFRLALGTLDFIRNIILRLFAAKTTTNYGSAYWSTTKEIKKRGHYKPYGLFLGACVHTGKPLFFSGETHGLTLSPAGGGKTVNFFIPALLHLGDTPMIVPDLKGTLACVTKKTRENLHKNRVYCVNPAGLFERKLGTPSRYNPLQIIKDSWTSSNQQDVITDAQAIALQLLIEPRQGGENSYFRNASRSMIVFCIIFLISQDTICPTLSDVLKLLRNNSELISALRIATLSKALKGELADIASDLLAKGEQSDKRQWESFREGAVQALFAFGSGGWLAQSTSACDFRFSDLKREKATIYLIADPTRMKVYAPWLGLLGWCALTELTRIQTNKQVIFLFDEAANFKIEGLTDKLTQLRSYGCRVWFALQSLDAFAKTYGTDDLQTLLEQCECQQYFGVQSYKTADFISKTLGSSTIKSQNYNLGHNIFDPILFSMSEQARPLLTADEVRRFQDCIIIIRGQSPIHALKVGYHEVSPWKKWAEKDPMYVNKLNGKTRIFLKY